jgi:hypothetical protein
MINVKVKVHTPWKNGSKYEGSWKNDRKEGKGTFVWNDGCKYEGDWKNDVRDGKGTFEYAKEINM